MVQEVENLPQNRIATGVRQHHPQSNIKKHNKHILNISKVLIRQHVQTNIRPVE